MYRYVRYLILPCSCLVFWLLENCWFCERNTSFLTHDLHIPTLQKEQLEVKESRGGRGNSGMTEDEVFSKVASLFKGQEDLLAEFGQFLPDAKRSLVSKKLHPPIKSCNC